MKVPSIQLIRPQPKSAQLPPSAPCSTLVSCMPLKQWLAEDISSKELECCFFSVPTPSSASWDLRQAFPSRFQRNGEKQDLLRILKDPKMHLVPLSTARGHLCLRKSSLSFIQILPQPASMESCEPECRGQEFRLKSQGGLLKAPPLASPDFG